MDIKQNYIQTCASINIISYINFLIFDIKEIARNQEVRYSRRPLYGPLEFIISDGSLDIILNEKKKNLEKDPDITKEKSTKNILDKLKSKIQAAVELLEKKSKVTNILCNLNLEILLSLFKVDKEITKEDIKQFFKKYTANTTFIDEMNKILTNNTFMDDVNMILKVLKGDNKNIDNFPVYLQLRSMPVNTTEHNMEKLIKKFLEEPKNERNYLLLMLGVIVLFIIDVMLAIKPISKLKN